MKLTDFDYQIPESHIAQYPLKERDSSRLFVLHKKSGTCEHRLFKDSIEYLLPGDVVVINDTKVIPVRLRGAKPTGGKAEITLLQESGINSWEALVKGVHEGTVLLPHGIIAQVSRLNGTMARVLFEIPAGPPGADIKNYLNEIGVMPLPVYIKRDAVKSDASEYQTVYAKNSGAVAAPTAGLHFTDNLLNALSQKGIIIKTVTLHVGYGTFRPVAVNDVRDHQMDEEFYEIPEDTAASVNAARAEKRRVIAVGTTATRTLEASAGEAGTDRIKPGTGRAAIFIYPDFRFRVADAVITNFHLPQSTPMMLASAFAGLDLLKKSYKIAQDKGYRFYSYGDAMFII